MKANFLFFLIAIGTHFSSWAGGAISGGEVTFKPLLSCNAASANPKMASPVSRVQVVFEVGFRGEVLQYQPLKVVLQNSRGATLGFLQTTTLPSAVDFSNLIIRRWSQVLKGQPNPAIGAIRVNGNSGSLSVRGEGAMDLRLDNCEYFAVAF